ncbi:peptide-methionine (R)-S-oxide reductase MsrB [Pseudotamlana carrageenivorans]|uniref:peptide-methionine (R)-S-oxide reductase n=1 Tax=Pseudotamlana carrageenivorans TaxID=2069432 RepID=A0A2I7SJW2_9FLAO|nr:peptide-methionine (R)-S-oxide reductase MsrB [Tamlana carrageenivorans]AUS06189.1 peptide-methionine (R)-S-oxide reductase [Tamlana carrageenivorans]
MYKILLAFCFLLFNCNSAAQKPKNSTSETYEITKTNAQWKAQLTDMEYHVLRQAGTEPRYSSPFNKNKQAGTYVCKACKTPLFKSVHKYDSGSGWPSFDREIEGNVAFSTDNDLGYTRIEEHCASCGCHLGHVFNDGPKETTGKRHCINGVALSFIPNK